ncbi:MAG: glycosyltransferase family 4 protein [Planctomycetota bacterium]
MKLLFVLHQYLPRHVTGTEQYVRSLARGLRAAGHEVTVFAYEPLIQFAAPGRDWFEQDEVVEDVPVRRCSVHPRHSANRELGEYENPLVAGMFARWLAGQSFDVVHVFHPRNIGMCALREPRRLGLPVVVHLMDFWFLCPNYLLLRSDGSLCDGPPDRGFGCIGCMDARLAEKVEQQELRPSLEVMADLPPPAAGLDPTPARRAQALVARKPTLFAELAQADAVIAPSRFLRQTFEAQGFPEGVIRHLPYGLDPSRGAVRPADARPRRDDFLHVGYIGSISEHKGVHVAIAAVRALERDDVRLHVHGGLESHPEYSEELQRLAGDDPRIAFEGRFESAQLGQVLSGLDCIAVPSLWYENTPFSVLEALNFGLPVLASDLGGIAEVVVHEQNGLLFPAGDGAALGAAIARLADDRALLQELAKGASVPDVQEDVAWLAQLYVEVTQANTARAR